ncbi:hypothetical protein As57867_006541, partial [Aphanomyces stellatus]
RRPLSRAVLLPHNQPTPPYHAAIVYHMLFLLVNLYVFNAGHMHRSLFDALRDCTLVSLLFHRAYFLTMHSHRRLMHYLEELQDRTMVHPMPRHRTGSIR